MIGWGAALAVIGLIMAIWAIYQNIEQDDNLVTPATFTGYLKDQLPYDSEKIQSILIHSGSNKEEIIVPEDREYILNQNLNWLDLSLARADPHILSAAMIMIHIQLPDGEYIIPYDIESNTYQLGDVRFYADDKVYGYMQGLFRPESELALIDRVSAQGYHEALENGPVIDESFVYDADRFELAGKDIHGWRDYLKEAGDCTYIESYYSSDLAQVEDIRYFPATGILAGDDLVFLKDTVETKDGIKVGLPKEEVRARLGKANLELDSDWSYKSGDSLKFHLYFADNKVVFIRLSLPL